jgi:hypothetical protein
MKLLGIGDLAKRWNYNKQEVQQKIQDDNEFPKSIAIINTKVLVFLEDDIIPYENKRPELNGANRTYDSTDIEKSVQKHPEKLWKIKKQKYRAIAQLEKVQQENIVLKEENSGLKSKLRENKLYS